jgi:hypothetical protein
VILAADSALQIAESAAPGHDSARLMRGRSDWSVPKLDPHAELSIVTDDATVSVVGTRFVVSIRSGSDGNVTCLEVIEGRVRAVSSVRQALVGAGERWVSRGSIDVCRDAAPPTARQPVAAASAPAPATSVEKPRRGTPAVAAGSTLSEENQLFLDAVVARRRGDKARALALTAEFLRRFPNSTLADPVREEQARASQLP